MKKCLFVAFLIVAFGSAFPKVEVLLGPSVQLDITTTDLSYSARLNAQAMYRMSYPFMLGISYGYQNDYQELGMLIGVRLLPNNWSLGMDLLLSGGLAKFSPSSFKYAYFGGGFAFNYFVAKNIISLRVLLSDLTVEDRAYTLLNAGIYIGFYL